MGKHLLVLDGLRGVAAISVVIYHFGARLPDLPWMQHGYLAVDFFFLLSGFVIAYAYEDRLRRGMTFRRFLALRLIRLAPLLVLGLLIGAVLELGRPVADYGAHLRAIASAAALGLAMTPTFHATSLEPVIFPLNSPAWSLFFEIIANLIYALVAPRLGLRALVAIVAASVPLLVATAFWFGGLDSGSGLIDWWGGGPRVMFSFTCGVLLFRLRETSWAQAISAPPAAIAAGLVVILAIPKLDGPANAIFDLVAALTLFPVMVAAAANAAPGRLARFCMLSGAISYPVYILHYRLLSAVAFKLRAAEVGAIGQAVGALAATVAITLLAYAVLRLYDEPVRAFLGRRKAAKTIQRENAAI